MAVVDAGLVGMVVVGMSVGELVGDNVRGTVTKNVEVTVTRTLLFASNVVDVYVDFDIVLETNKEVGER